MKLDMPQGDEPQSAEPRPVIDLEGGLHRLMNNKKLYFTLLGKFKGREMVDDLISKIQEGDFSKTAQAAHGLKGVSANLGLVQLTETVKNIEARAKMEMETEGLIDLLNEVAEVTQSSIEALLEGKENN